MITEVTQRDESVIRDGEVQGPVCVLDVGGGFRYTVTVTSTVHRPIQELPTGGMLPTIEPNNAKQLWEGKRSGIP